MGVAIMRRYEQALERAQAALDAGNGWKAAQQTHEGVEVLRAMAGLGKAEAQERFAHELNRPRFSATSARRYYDLWEKFGPKEQRLVDSEGHEMSFGEHYAVVRGGQRALERIELAKQSGRGIHYALQQNISDTDEHRIMMLAARIRNEIDTLERLTKPNGISRLEKDMLKVFLLGVEDSVQHMLDLLN